VDTITNHQTPVRSQPALQPRLLGYEELRALGIKYHRTHLWHLIKKKRFPEPVALTPGRYGRKAWRAADIDAWLASRPLIGKAV